MHKDQLCRKRPVVAVLVTPVGEVFIGGNRITQPQSACPRAEQGYVDGEGWHLCKDVCRQIAHAEIDALNQAGDKARRGTLFLIGHWTACKDCAKAIAKAGADLKIITPRHDEQIVTQVRNQTTRCNLAVLDPNAEPLF